MAALTYQATRNTTAGGAHMTHTVARSTDDGIGSAVAALVVDNTATKLQVREAVQALLRGLGRDELSASAPAQYPTSGSTVE